MPKMTIDGALSSTDITLYSDGACKLCWQNVEGGVKNGKGQKATISEEKALRFGESLVAVNQTCIGRIGDWNHL